MTQTIINRGIKRQRQTQKQKNNHKRKFVQETFSILRQKNIEKVFVSEFSVWTFLTFLQKLIAIQYGEEDRTTKCEGYVDKLCHVWINVGQTWLSIDISEANYDLRTW